jgi:hypothetical protein
LAPYLSVGLPMPGLCGPPVMMCPPWAGWYEPWAPPPMHFHLGWSGPAQGFGYEGYYAGDGRYGHTGHQQDRRASRPENRTAQNAKPDHPVSQEATTTPGHRQEQEAPKDGSFADQMGGSQEKTGPWSESSANGEAKPNAEMGLLLIRWEAVKRRHSQGVNLRPMGKRNPMQREP